MNKNHLISMAAILIVVGILAFYGGIQYANASKGAAGNILAQGGQFGQGRNRLGGGQFGKAQAGTAMLNGEILSVDAQSVTVKLADGGSKIAFLSATTKISKTIDATLEDLKVGESLMVNGKDNADGSVTAQTIQLRNKPVVDQNAKIDPQAKTPSAAK